MREWLSGRASPCQGERREFESRLPLQGSCFIQEPFYYAKRGVKNLVFIACTLKDSNFKRQKRLISFLPFGLLVNGYFLPFLMIFSVLARSNSHNITELPYKMIDTLITAFFGYFCK